MIVGGINNMKTKVLATLISLVIVMGIAPCLAQPGDYSCGGRPCYGFSHFEGEGIWQGQWPWWWTPTPYFGPWNMPRTQFWRH